MRDANHVVMGIADDGRVKLLVGGLVFSLLALVGVAAFGVVAGLSALFAAPASAPLIVVLLNAVAPYAITAALLGALSFVLTLGLAVSAVRRASVPRSERLARLARLVERFSAEARRFGLAERFEPTTEDRIDELKREYVEGEITELEYERRLQDLMAGGDADDRRVRGGPSRTDRGRLDRELER
ncbi:MULTISPECIES: SHOCT domain-containing protein [Halorussus]|uniref:SHOCT domain-containing protein n=1 Tax=Halorussus TaxID=1070314 RepID=UPI000E21133B|nr:MULTISPECIES: SHOCT domain-containing protein [Halorussus]NHN57997.1 SHOCT domain-containing protein [Halorussus sp. JP-T4]